MEGGKKNNGSRARMQVFASQGYLHLHWCHLKCNSLQQTPHLIICVRGWKDGGEEERPPMIQPPFCASEMSLIISIYPPRTSANLAEPPLSPYPRRCENYPDSTLSRLGCKPPRLDKHPPTPPISSERKWELKKQERSGAATSAWDVGKSDETRDVFHATTCHIFVYKR